MSEASVGEGASAGALLRQAREDAGLHVATLAANLKVPVRKLEALEEDRYDLLPDAVFVRALASSVCRTLKVDPQPVLERLPQTAQPRLVPDHEGINAPFRAPSDGPSPGWLDQVSRPVVLVVLALLVGALVIVFLPAVQQAYEFVSQAASQPDPVLPPPGAGSPNQVQAAPASVAPGTVVTPALPATPPASASVALPSPQATTVSPGPSVAPATAQPTTAGPAATAAATAAPAAAAPSGIVVFRTRGPSWVEVTDATGATVLRRLMMGGESAGVTGRLPLAVTVGDAGQTEVQVRGKPYDLARIARDNVARFEVK